jgi:hypothetical protein
MKYTLLFTPLEGEDKGFDFTVVEKVFHRAYKLLQAKGFPIEELTENSLVTGVYPNVGSRFDGVRGIFTKEIS